MTRRGLCKGQSLAEYAIVLGMVIGAVLAMQNYVGSRIKGTIRSAMDGYETAATSGSSGIVTTPFIADEARTVTGKSATDMDMTAATTGSLHSYSDSNTTIPQQ